MIAIGIDIGGTQIKAVVVNAADQLIAQEVRPTKDNGRDSWKNEVVAVINKIKTTIPEPDFIIGISAPGLPDRANSTILSMPGRLEGLEGFNWSQFLHAPAYVLNDTVAALIAEAGFGVAKGKKNVVMLTLGTGVGGAILIDGKPYQGSFGKAGHIGHMVINCAGAKDITGMPGSLETCIGNYSIAERSRGRFTSTKALVSAAETGDAEAIAIWQTSIHHLALGIASLANILSPELVVLGGGITTSGETLFGPLRKLVNEYEWTPYGSAVEIVKAEYGEMAGALGAACFARQKNREQQQQISNIKETLINHR